MTNIKVTGRPSFAITGNAFVATVPVAAYDEGGWTIAQTTLSVAGLASDTAASVKTKLQSQALTWKGELAAIDNLQKKLAGLEGMPL